MHHGGMEQNVPWEGQKSTSSGGGTSAGGGLAGFVGLGISFTTKLPDGESRNAYKQMCGADQMSLAVTLMNWVVNFPLMSFFSVLPKMYMQLTTVNTTL